MEVFAEYKLFFYLNKCEFEQKRIEYLGLVISENKVEMDLVKVFGVYEWPVSKSQSDVQAFFGFVSFYCCFIWDFSIITCPLFDFTRSSSTCTWENKQKESFNALKKMVTSTFVLVFPDDAKSFCVGEDSSEFATGAILPQQSEVLI